MRRVVLLGWALVLGFAAPSEASFVVTPMELHFETQAGGASRAEVHVTNRGDETLLVRLQMADSRFLEDGSERTLAAGTEPRSCADWVELPGNVVEIPPRESVKLDLTLAVPANADGSYWSKIYFEEIQTPATTDTSQAERTYHVFMRQRVGVRVFQETPGTGRPDAIITNVARPEEEAGGPTSVLVRVENPGNTILRCQGHVELRDAQGMMANKIMLGTQGRFVLFPDGARNLVGSPAELLPPGTYTALAIIDFGGEHLVAGDTVFRIPGQVIVTGQEGP